jgi:hypothetical protein
MKSSYEIAMERLGKASPIIKLTAEQKKRLAELDSIYAAKIAQEELSLQADLNNALANDEQTAQNIRQHLTNMRRKLQEELEYKKDAIRQEK